MVSDNPVLSAQMFDVIIQTTLKHLFGLECGAKKTKESIVGVFGPIRAYYGVMECQCRGSLHFHCVVWSHIGASRFSSVASDLVKNRDFGSAIDTIVCETLDKEFHDVLKEKEELGKRYASHYRSTLQPVSN